MFRGGSIFVIGYDLSINQEGYIIIDGPLGMISNFLGNFYKVHADEAENYVEDIYIAPESSSRVYISVSQGGVVCKGNCKSADKCKRFLEFFRDSRWAVVREFELCSTCLRQNKGN